MIDTLGFRARAVIGARWFPSKEHSTEDYLMIFNVIAIAIAIAPKSMPLVLRFDAGEPQPLRECKTFAAAPISESLAAKNSRKSSG